MDAVSDQAVAKSEENQGAVAMTEGNGAPPPIALDHLTKVYPIYNRPLDRLKELLWRGKRRYHQPFTALSDLSLTIHKGQTVGVIGHNGSGKSTLLQLVAGVLTPTSGHVTVNGRVSALLELGAGFNPEFTGRDNVMLGGAVMGFSRDEMAARLPAIAAFAELGDFLDQPVKTYSSGMYVRLAFALAIHVEPEVLLIDEALAVGDAVFQHRCLAKIRELKDNGVTILFVSHDTATVKALCDHAVLLEGGRLVEQGAPEAVVNRYHGLVSRQIAAAPYQVDALPEGARGDPENLRPVTTPPLAGGQNPQTPPDAHATVGGDALKTEATGISGTQAETSPFGQTAGFFRHGTGAARFTNVQLLTPDGHPTRAINTRTPVTLQAKLTAHAPLGPIVVGFYVKDRLGAELIGSNTAEEGVAMPLLGDGQELAIAFSFNAAFRPGHYSVTVAVAYNRQDPVYLDWVDHALVFEVLPDGLGRTVHGLVDVPVAIATQLAIDSI